MTFVANVANHGTAPDLTASWWISAYTKGFAIGVVLLGFVLLYETVQVARRKTSGDELVETIGIWVPAWFAGVLFGPPLAQFLITGASYLTDGIVSSMTGYGAGDAFTAVAQATKDGAQVQQAGELVMALLSRDRGAGVGAVGVHLAVRAGGDHLPGLRGVRDRLGVGHHRAAPGVGVADPAAVHRDRVLQGVVVLPVGGGDGDRRRVDGDDRGRGRRRTSG